MQSAEQDSRKIRKLILREKSLLQAREYLRAGRSVNLFGLSDPAKLWYAAALQAESGRPLVLLVPDEARLRVAEEELKEIIAAGKSEGDRKSVV